MGERDLSGKNERIIMWCTVQWISPLLRGPLTPTTSELLDHKMYDTEGVDSVATITELRSDTSALIEHVQDTKNGVLIQKNNEPHAVLISWETYKALKEKVDLDDL